MTHYSSLQYNPTIKSDYIKSNYFIFYKKTINQIFLKYLFNKKSPAVLRINRLKFKFLS